MHTVFGRSAAQLRFDWGLAGALALAGQPVAPGQAGTAVVVVDVLSFGTAVSVATDLGIETFPYRWRDHRAAEFAATHGAQLAGGRRQGGVSLSPASIRAWATAHPSQHTPGDQPPQHTPGDRPPHRVPDQPPNYPADDQPPSAGRPTSVRDRLVLPSPNGSTICFTLSDRGNPVLAGSLRSAAVIADWLARELAAGRLRAVAVVAAGERWPDGTLRPAVEDLWGAGAVLDRLHRRAPGLAMSPEARTAAAAFAAIEPELSRHLLTCASGRELAEAGFVQDVAIAAELDAAVTAPLLERGRFRAA